MQANKGHLWGIAWKLGLKERHATTEKVLDLIHEELNQLHVSMACLVGANIDTTTANTDGCRARITRFHAIARKRKTSLSKKL